MFEKKTKLPSLRNQNRKTVKVEPKRQGNKTILELNMGTKRI